MAPARKTNRRTCRIADPSISIAPSSPRKAQSIVDTPRQVRLLRDAEATADKMSRTQLFKAHVISKTTGYRILKSKTPRRSDLVHNRGRKSVLASYEREAIETVENSSFHAGIASHYTVASSIGLANRSERAIRRNMTEHDVGTYMTQQKKFIQKSSIEKREL